MSDPVDAGRWDSADDRQQDGIDTVESYEVDDGTVFYDAENPLAWVEATNTVRLDELA